MAEKANERVRCCVEGCPNTILLATAKANDGRCAPCVQKLRVEERKEYIRQNRREVDLYTGITDVVEIIRAMHTPRTHDPLVVLRPPPKSSAELYSALNADQANRLASIAADAMRAGETDFAEDIGKSLAIFTEYPLDKMLEAWVERNHYWPAVVFRGAGTTIRDAVVRALGAGVANANHALSALAWIGDDKVVDLFRQWDAKPPGWRKHLHVQPSRHAHVAGWELYGTKRRNLFHNECWAIAPAEAGEEPVEVMQVMQKVDQSCPWCKQLLVHLINLDPSDGRFAFLEIAGSSFPVLTCDACTCYGAGFIYSRVSADGASHLVTENKRPPWLPENISSWARNPWSGRAVRLSQRRAIYAADWCLPVNISQVGGIPSWVQDTAFPKCPDCATTMKFMAQIDNAQFPGHEGVYYAFLCASCRVTATTYQQT